MAVELGEGCVCCVECCVVMKISRWGSHGGRRGRPVRDYARFACDICASLCTLSKKVKCPMCEKSACQKCVQKYQLSLNSLSPKCMFCQVIWTSKTACKLLSGHFVSTLLADHYKSILKGREMAFFPEAQRYLPIYRRILELVPDASIPYLTEKVESQSVWSREFTEEGENPTEVPMKCSNDYCVGFVNAESVCTVCEHMVCRTCLAVLGPVTSDTVETTNLLTAHVCKPEDLDTLAEMRKNAKPCPNSKCRILTSKIEGCSQMFCVVCRTAWDWNTEDIVRGGFLHNPHYLDARDCARAEGRLDEFNREVGIEPNEDQNPRRNRRMLPWIDERYIMLKYREVHLETMPCGEEEVALWSVHVNESDFFTNCEMPLRSMIDFDFFSDGIKARRAYYYVSHVRHLFQLPYENTFVSVIDRLRFMNGDIDEKKWLSRVNRRHRQEECENIVRDILHTLCDTMRDMWILDFSKIRYRVVMRHDGIARALRLPSDDNWPMLGDSLIDHLQAVVRDAIDNIVDVYYSYGYTTSPCLLDDMFYRNRGHSHAKWGRYR